MSRAFVKWTGVLKSVKDVKAHAKYVGFRSQELNEKGFFTKDHDQYHAYQNFIDRIKDNPALQHSKSAKAHKLIFSMKDKDYEAFKRSGMDYKNIIRNVLNEYERRHGLKLDWMANVHEKDHHPHAHVIVKGVSDNQDENGRYQRIYFNKESFQELRDLFDKEIGDHAEYRWYEEMDIDRGFYDLSKQFEQASAAIENEIKKQQQQGEFEREFNTSVRKDKGRSR